MSPRDALILASLLAASAGAGHAAEPPAKDAPMATASGAPQVADQIQAFIDSSPAAESRRSLRGDLDDELPLPDRKVHGEVSVGVGTHGYRSAYARSDMPVGKSGTLSIAVGEERGRGPGYGYGYSPYGYGGYGGARDRQSLSLGFDWSRQSADRDACREARDAAGDTADGRRCVVPPGGRAR